MNYLEDKFSSMYTYLQSGKLKKVRFKHVICISYINVKKKLNILFVYLCCLGRRHTHTVEEQYVNNCCNLVLVKYYSTFSKL
jgi:hypothetical protein